MTILLLQSGPGAVATVVGTTSWNPADKSASILLTNGNLTVGCSANTDNAVRGVSGQSSGKFYYEVTYATTLLGGDTGCGITTSSAVLTTAANNATSSAIAYVASGGPIWYSGAVSGKTLGSTAAAGDFVCVAVDMVNKKIWFRRNAGNWNGTGGDDPATNTGGLNISSVFSASSACPIMAINSTTPTLTANFGSSAFAQSVPSGFTAGWPA